MKHDLVVFVPGILGSRLTRNGKDVWALSLQALLGLRHPTRLWRDFALPAGIGDARPQGRHAVRPEGLLTTPSVLPGLLSHLGYQAPHLGYPNMRAALGVPDPEQFLTFAYDWRQSNRLSAADLARTVETALDRWRPLARKRHPGSDPARVVLLCHSMGGLIARHYLEALNGRETARALVTIGTPHRGAAKALRVLTGHARPPAPGQRRARRWIGERLVELCRTFPSVAQLLPVYAAVTRPGSSRWLTLADVDVPGLERDLVREAFAFHNDFTKAKDANEANLTTGGYRVAAMGGRLHPTLHGVTLSQETLDFRTSLAPGQTWTGDGTVPEESAFAKWALRGMGDGLWTGHRHSALPVAEAVCGQLTHIWQDRPASQTLSTHGDFGVEIPDLAIAGEPFDVVAKQVEPGRAVRARLVGSGAETPLRPDGTGDLLGALVGPAGTHVVEVVAEHPLTVHRDTILVLDADADT